MKMHRYGKLGLIACIAVFAASVQVRANMAAASGALADIYVAATSAYNTMAGATKGSDEAKKATEEVEAMEKIITAAMAAYATLEATNGGDEDAMKALIEARNAAVGDNAPTPGSDSRPPHTNIHRDLSEWPALQKLNAKQQEINDATSAKGGEGYTERDTDFTGI